MFKRGDIVKCIEEHKVNVTSLLILNNIYTIKFNYLDNSFGIVHIMELSDPYYPRRFIKANTILNSDKLRVARGFKE